MKNRLTEIYKKYLVVDPNYLKDYPNLVSDMTTMMNKFYSSNFKTVRDMYQRSINSITFATSRDDKPISGSKAFISPELRLCATQESFFPWEVDLFKFDSSYIKFLVMELILEKYQCSIDELGTGVYKNEMDIVDSIIPELETTLKDQEFFGFYGGDPYNHTRTRPLKKRKLEFIKFSDKKSYYSYDRSALMKDTKTNEELTIHTGWGWCLYPDLEIMNTRLSDLEAYWMVKFDKEAKSIDREIEIAEKNLEKLKTRKTKYLNSVSTYSKKVKELLWKDF